MEPTSDDSWGWFGPAFDDFLSRKSPPDVNRCDFFAEHQAEFGFDKFETVLSVGPGYGHYDLKVLESFPACSHYIGIEPLKDSVIYLDKKLAEHYPNIKHTLVQAKVEDWCGPPVKVDMILASHVLYHVQEPRSIMLEKFLSWLKPGGLLVIMLTGEGLIVQIRRNLKSNPRGASAVYFQSKLKEDLKMLGANILCERTYTYDCNVQNPTKELANFCQLTDCTDEQVQEVYSILDKLVPSGFITDTVWITVVKKD